MPKINQEEYEVLKELDGRWKWIARDEDNTLVMGAGKSERYLDGWFPPVNVGDSLVVDETNAVKDISEYGNLFQFIRWEDEEPYNIAELIREYEWAQLNEKYPPVRESEEKEVKDLEWAKNEIENLYSLTFDAYRAAFKANNEHFEKENSTQLALISKVLEIFDQLDEPEVLSPEWIEDNEFLVNDESGVDYTVVESRKLKDLLVPKQEEVDRAYKDGYEKGRELGFYKGYREGLANKGGEPEVLSQELPVIPKFVADYINRKKKGGNSLDGAFAYIKAYGWDDESSYDYEVYKWLGIGSNDETFARAWLDGYTVEKEQEYVVELLYGVLAYHQLDDCWDVFDTGEIEGNEEWLYQFTEQEIKDYDERFWPFAVKIEELEE